MAPVVISEKQQDSVELQVKTSWLEYQWKMIISTGRVCDQKR